MKKTDKRRKALILLAVLRAVLAVAALLAAGFLFEDHFLWLVLMRPTKEVFLFGAFLARRQGDPMLLGQVFLAGLPVAVAGVWLFYYLGRIYSDEIESGELPGIKGKLLPPEKVKAFQRTLERRGFKLVLLGRLAAFPSTVVGAAAGSSDVPSRRFLGADALGALLSIVQVMAIGYLLGHLFDPDEPLVSWTVTALAAAATIGLLYLLGLYLRKDTDYRKGDTARFLRRRGAEVKDALRKGGWSGLKSYLRRSLRQSRSPRRGRKSTPSEDRSRSDEAEVRT